MRTRILALALLLACPAREPAGETGADATQTSGMSTTGDPTIGAPTTGTTTDAASDTGGTTEVAPPGSPAEACADFCHRLYECDLDGAFDGCPCNADLGGEACLLAWATTSRCFAASTCAELHADDSPCWGDYVAALDQCYVDEGGCAAYTVQPGPPGGCAFGEDCVGKPSRELVCTGETCVCTIDDIEVGSCAAAGICDMLMNEAAKLDECCAQ